jgi:hypothetical protein
MESTKMYMVYKFFPPRCPKCEQEFNSTTTFAIWSGKGKSFADSIKTQRELFFEIFPPSEMHGRVGYSNKFDIDFILCQSCKNITMRIDYASRQVTTEEEAVFLVEEQDFTGWQEIITYGNMTRPIEHLSMLAQADILMLRKAVGEARTLAMSEKDQAIGTDLFSATLDPALIGIVNKIRQEKASLLVHKKLSLIFGDLWNELTQESQDFLVSAEVLKDELMSFAETETAIDFTPAVLAYSKSLEREMLDKIFIAFRESPFSKSLPDPTGKKSLDRSIDTLKAFLENRRNITLGDMGFCLLNVGCKLSKTKDNGFANFLQETFMNFDELCDEKKVPARIIKYTDDYRNRAAHVSRLSKEECLAARAFLLDEPIRLLLTLIETYKKT